MLLDHIAIGAADLNSGVEYLSDLLGVSPLGGGKHELMGTHNALWRLESEKFPVYLEIIAIDPDATPPSRPRWFGLDDPRVQPRFEVGPKLLTYVASTNDIEFSRTEMKVDPGPATLLSRGELNWLFTLPAEGKLCADGALPYLIEWKNGVSPVENMKNQGLELMEMAGNRLEEISISFPCPVSYSPAAFEIELGTMSGKTIRFSTA